MNEWTSIFENEKTLEQNIREALEEVGEKPTRISKMFWFFFLQICIAIMLLVFSILFPIWIMYGW